MKAMYQGALLALCLLLLGGCAVNVSIEGDIVVPTGAEQEVLGAAQEVQVLDREGVLVKTLRDADTLDPFLDTLLEGDWTPAVLPDQAQALGTFVFRQPETLKLGQRWEDREMVEAARLTVYDREDLVALEAAGMRLCFQLPGAAGCLEAILREA